MCLLSWERVWRWIYRFSSNWLVLSTCNHWLKLLSWLVSWRLRNNLYWLFYILSLFFWLYLLIWLCYKWNRLCLRLVVTRRGHINLILLWRGSLSHFIVLLILRCITNIRLRYVIRLTLIWWKSCSLKKYIINEVTVGRLVWILYSLVFGIS